MEKSRDCYYKKLGELDPPAPDEVEEEEDVEDPDCLQARVRREHMVELYSGDFPDLRLAYEDWERSCSGLQKRVERGREVARFAKKEVWHLLWVFLVVEGVLLITLSQAQLLTCENWWVCFFLSFLASLVLLVPLVQRVTTLWSVRSRVGALLLALEVLSRRIHVMKTLGPLECTFDEKADDVVMRKVLMKPGLCATIYRMVVIITTILAFVFLLILGVQVRCEGSMKMPQRLHTFLKFSPTSLTP